MSRIQQILDKAERDGSVRHTTLQAPPPPATEPHAPPRPFVPVDGHRATAPAEAPWGHGQAVPEAPRVGRQVQAGRLSPLLVAALAPHALAAEQYRTLRTRLAAVDHGHPRRVLVVTSPAKGDGKSVTAANLALTMAQEFNRRIVLVDADLRRPSLHRLLGLPVQPGLADVLRGEAPLEEALVQLPEYGLTVLPAGGRVDRQTELLGSQAMRRVIDALRSRFDRVVIDTPPALPLADVAVVAPMTDGVLLVVRAGATPKPLIERALAAFDDSRLLGLVLNGTGHRDATYEAYADRALTD
jgi:capsular exopolysaccharide synthesis family protein